MILAGGDGTRLQSLTRRISGDDRPKQFVQSLPDKRCWIRPAVASPVSVVPEQTLTVVTRTHEHFYKSLKDAKGLLMQPENKGTAPAILFSLMRIAQLSPSATVAFFPSDHYFADDEEFMSHVECAFSAAQTHPATSLCSE